MVLEALNWKKKNIRPQMTDGRLKKNEKKEKSFEKKRHIKKEIKNI